MRPWKADPACICAGRENSRASRLFCITEDSGSRQNTSEKDGNTIFILKNRSVNRVQVRRGDIYYADLSPVVGSEPVSYTHLWIKLR